MTFPLRSTTFLLGCLTLLLFASCGEDEAPPQAETAPSYSILLTDAAAALEKSTGQILNFNSTSPPSSPAELNTSLDQFKSLTARAAEIGAIPESQMNSTNQFLRSTWNPALGQLHAATRASVENPASSPETIKAIRALNTQIAEFDRTLYLR